MNTDRVDALLKYALAVRSQGEFRENELGPIHLIKYVYLADLAHAERTGETYTGVEWTFYHFGPWAQPVHARIEPVIRQLGAHEYRTTSAKYEGDVVRWRVEDADDLERELARALPVHAAAAMKKAIRDHGDDTGALLHYVYSTLPMLEARPHDVLRFPKPPAKTYADAAALAPPVQLSVRDQKRKADRLRELQAEAKRRLAAKPKKLVVPMPAPRYDETFYEGLASLERSDLSPLPATGELHFDDSVWDSDLRKNRHDDET